jgi:hypothetical protein
MICLARSLREVEQVAIAEKGNRPIGLNASAIPLLSGILIFVFIFTG